MGLRQMRYNGLLATVQMRRVGYPHRLSHAMLLRKIQGLVLGYTAAVQPTQNRSVELLTAVQERTMMLKEAGRLSHSAGFDGWVVGKHKAYLKHWHVEILNSMATEHHTAATLLQSYARMWTSRRNYRKMWNKNQDDLAQATTFLAGVGLSSGKLFASLQALGDEEARRGPEGLGIAKKVVKRNKKAKKQAAAVDAKQLQAKAKRFEKDADKARRAAIKWWAKHERARKHHVDQSGGVFTWFHGLITRADAEEYLLPCPAGTFLLRVSERYNGYAISLKVPADRIKHYRVALTASKDYTIDGSEVDHGSLVDLIQHYSAQPLPSLDATPETLQVALAVTHDLGLGIDARDESVKPPPRAGKRRARRSSDTTPADFGSSGGGAIAAFAAAKSATLARKRDGGAPDNAGESDDTVFGPAVPVPGRKQPRWLRGELSRKDAVAELRDRGLVDGRFLVRQKERSADHVSLAISYAFRKEIFHHLLLRRRGQPWFIDGSMLQFPDGRGRQGPILEAVALLQTRPVPQLATTLERDAAVAPPRGAGSILASVHAPKPRGLQIRLGVDSNRISQLKESAAASTAPAADEAGGPALASDPRGPPGVTMRVKPDGAAAEGGRPKSKLLGLPGLGIGPANASPSRPVARAGRPRPTQRMPARDLLGAPPGAVDVDGDADEPVYDAHTGRRVTGIPRVKLNQTSTLDDVLGWVVSIGLIRYMKNFVKKKMTGAKLFAASEKSLRKLVKPEDDFVLLSRALRQAKAYSETVPDSFVPASRGIRAPFRSVRRSNPLHALEEADAEGQPAGNAAVSGGEEPRPLGKPWAAAQAMQRLSLQQLPLPAYGAGVAQGDESENDMELDL